MYVEMMLWRAHRAHELHWCQHPGCLRPALHEVHPYWDTGVRTSYRLCKAHLTAWFISAEAASCHAPPDALVVIE
jgi:hypothetical protein